MVLIRPRYGYSFGPCLFVKVSVRVSQLKTGFNLERKKYLEPTKYMLHSLLIQQIYCRRRPMEQNVLLYVLTIMDIDKYTKSNKSYDCLLIMLNATNYAGK